MAKETGRRSSVGWVNSAFVVEAIILLLFVVASIAVFMQLYSMAAQTGSDGVAIAHAASAAQSTAEKFAAHPLEVPEVEKSGDLVVTTDVVSEQTAAGTLYSAHIVVTDSAGEAEVFSLDTARYVSGGDAE